MFANGTGCGSLSKTLLDPGIFGNLASPWIYTFLPAKRTCDRRCGCAVGRKVHLTQTACTRQFPSYRRPWLLFFFVFQGGYVRVLYYPFTCKTVDSISDVICSCIFYNEPSFFFSFFWGPFINRGETGRLPYTASHTDWLCVGAQRHQSRCFPVAINK